MVGGSCDACKARRRSRSRDLAAGTACLRGLRLPTVVCKKPPMRLLMLLRIILLAVLALGTGNPEMFGGFVDATFTAVFGR